MSSPIRPKGDPAPVTLPPWPEPPKPPSLGSKVYGVVFAVVMVGTIVGVIYYSITRTPEDDAKREAANKAFCPTGKIIFMYGRRHCLRE